MPARIRPVALDSDRLGRFESFVEEFRPVFQRADQFVRFRAYLRGILEPTERKNVEAIAAAATANVKMEANLAQALQHFVSHSPWDHRRLLSALRRRSRSRRHDPDAHWVVHDGVFVKKGRHSVGVQRQFARSMGKKINCQIGIFVTQHGPRGCFPLAVRLYLPSYWLRENAQIVEKQIPRAEREKTSKIDVALSLLDELLEEGESTLPIVAESGYASSEAFFNQLIARGLTTQDSAGDVLTESLERFEWLKSDFGLDHFEGRNWAGWHHHVALALTAYHFLAVEPR